MSPQTEKVFLDCVVPALQRLVPVFVYGLYVEDRADLLQDCIIRAYLMMQAAEKMGKAPDVRTTVYFVIQGARSGRRLAQAGRVDVMGAAAQLDNHVSLESLDAYLDGGEEGEPTTLHDLLPGPTDDPALRACRSLDYEKLLAALSKMEWLVLLLTGAGFAAVEQSMLLGLTPGRISQIRKRAGEKVRAVLGNDVLVQIQARPVWFHNVNCMQERFAARFFRRKV